MLPLVFSVPISRVLCFCKTKVFVIYLLLPSRVVSSNLPPDIGRTALHASVYLVLQSVVRTAIYVAIYAGGLLPHLLTLTLSGGYFLLRSPTITDSFYFQKHGVLYCPDFPLFLPQEAKPATNRHTCLQLRMRR